MHPKTRCILKCAIPALVRSVCAVSAEETPVVIAELVKTIQANRPDETIHRSCSALGMLRAQGEQLAPLLNIVVTPHCSTSVREAIARLFVRTLVKSPAAIDLLRTAFNQAGDRVRLYLAACIYHSTGDSSHLIALTESLLTTDSIQHLRDVSMVLFHCPEYAPRFVEKVRHKSRSDRTVEFYLARMQRL